MSEINLRNASKEDIPQVHSIEKKVYPAPWSKRFFHRVLNMGNSFFMIAEKEPEIIGYTIGTIEKSGRSNDLKKAGHILNIAIKPEYQRKGIGTSLLKEVEKRFTDRNAYIAYLEVRISNLKAQKMYKQMGYKYLETVKNYYDNEDAIVMTKKLTR